MTKLIAAFRLRTVSQLVVYGVLKSASERIQVFDNAGPVLLAEWFPASSPRIKQSNNHFKHQAIREELFLDSWTFEDEASTNLRNVGNSTRNYTESQILMFC